MDIYRVSPAELVHDLATDNPPPGEKWFQRDDFDPTYGARELREAAKRGWIELETHDEPELWRFRLTPLGRSIL